MALYEVRFEVMYIEAESEDEAMNAAYEDGADIVSVIKAED